MPTTEQSIWDDSFKAENDLSAKQFYAVELSAEDQVDVCDNAGDTVMGVLQNKPKAGEEAQVRINGLTQWVSDGTANGGIAAGDRVGTDANGKCVKKTVAAGVKLAGIARQASTTDGAVITVQLTPGVYGSA